MKRTKTVLMVLVLAGVIGSANVKAKDGHGDGHNGGHNGGHYSSTSVGFVFGAPGYWPYYGPPAHPYYPNYYPYYYTPMIAVPYSPPVYVERGQDEVPSEQYWYFCSDPQGYYPYIRNCNTNWQRVTPAPNRN